MRKTVEPPLPAGPKIVVCLFCHNSQRWGDEVNYCTNCGRNLRKPECPHCRKSLHDEECFVYVIPEVKAT